jgi:hypothetical protein
MAESDSGILLLLLNSIREILSGIATAIARSKASP